MPRKVRENKVEAEGCGLRNPARLRYFSVLKNMQYDCEAHQVSCSIGICVLSRGSSGLGIRLTTHLHLLSWLFYLFSTTHCSLLKLIVRSGLDVPTFATRRLHACHHARALSGERWKCGREVSGKFCLNAEFHVTFRDLLHAVKLRHGNDGFTSPPKEGVLRNFSP
jgi:hypothetical protein